MKIKISSFEERSLKLPPEVFDDDEDSGPLSERGQRMKRRRMTSEPEGPIFKEQELGQPEEGPIEKEQELGQPEEGPIEKEQELGQPEEGPILEEDQEYQEGESDEEVIESAEEFESEQVGSDISASDSASGTMEPPSPPREDHVISASDSASGTMEPPSPPREDHVRTVIKAPISRELALLIRAAIPWRCKERGLLSLDSYSLNCDETCCNHDKCTHVCHVNESGVFFQGKHSYKSKSGRTQMMRSLADFKDCVNAALGPRSNFGLRHKATELLESWSAKAFQRNVGSIEMPTEPIVIE